MKDDDEGSGFGDKWTDICDCRVASATEKDSRMTQKFGFFFLRSFEGTNPGAWEYFWGGKMTRPTYLIVNMY